MTVFCCVFMYLELKNLGRMGKETMSFDLKMGVWRKEIHALAPNRSHQGLQKQMETLYKNLRIGTLAKNKVVSRCERRFRRGALVLGTRHLGLHMMKKS